MQMWLYMIHGVRIRGGGNTLPNMVFKQIGLGYGSLDLE